MREKAEKRIKELRRQKEALKKEWHSDDADKEAIISKIEEINTIIYEIQGLL